MTATTRCWCVMPWECGELLYGKRFPLWLKGAVYWSYVMPATLYGCEAWCLKKSEMGILRMTVRFMVRATCGVQLKDRKRYTDLMFMLGLSETIELVGYGEQCSLIWSCFVERERSYFENGPRFRG